MTNEQFDEILEKLREKALGNTIENVVETYKKNADGDLVLDNKTLKKIKNEIDTQACIKLIDIELKKRELEKELNPLEKLSDEELERRKQNLIAELRKQIENGEY